ncbi:hypothetical protein FB451DRAFT_1406602 [Mycena latifolia]|nr:hypothetical protein FB451DRAFT_1406602 [Mycena latifolia]
MQRFRGDRHALASDNMEVTCKLSWNLLPRSPAPHVFASIGNDAYFRGLGIPAVHTYCLDLLDARRVRTDVSATHAVEFDTLWGGWVVEGAGTARPPTRVYLAGDTGYRAVMSSTDYRPETLPVCPAFKEIGVHWDTLDFAVIPIGAYAPQRFMSPIHCAPRDSVAIFRDTRALGMHWGAWVLTTEDILEPPSLLVKECARAGVKEGVFGILAWLSDHRNAAMSIPKAPLLPCSIYSPPDSPPSRSCGCLSLALQRLLARLTPDPKAPARNLVSSLSEPIIEK